MTIAPVESGESQNCTELRAPSSADTFVPVRESELSGFVHQSVAEIIWTLVGLAGRRLNENLSFSKELGEQESALGVARTYSSYWRMMLGHYGAAFAQLQLVNLTLIGEVLRARPLLVRSTQFSQQEQTARLHAASRDSFS